MRDRAKIAAAWVAFIGYHVAVFPVTIFLVWCACEKRKPPTWD